MRRLYCFIVLLVVVGVFSQGVNAAVNKDTTRKNELPPQDALEMLYQLPKDKIAKVAISDNKGVTTVKITTKK